MSTAGFPGVPKLLPDEKEHRRQIAQMLNDRVNRGKFNCTTTITLTASASSTTLTDERIGYGSFIGLMPQTSHAATALSNIYIDPTETIKGQCTIHHNSNSQTDRTFTVLIVG